MSSDKVFPTLVGEVSGNETHSGILLDPIVSGKHCLSASDTHLSAIWTSMNLAGDSTVSGIIPKPLSMSLGDETCTKVIECAAAAGCSFTVTVSTSVECTKESITGSVPAWDMSFWDRASFLNRITHQVC